MKIEKRRSEQQNEQAAKRRGEASHLAATHRLLQFG
jgi:hypothetical protein